MDDELRRKLIENIEVSGFGSEMRALRVVQEAGWYSSGPSAYYDRDAAITREIDLVAYRSRYWDGTRDSGTPVSIECFYALSAEVKKTSVPWIVFRGTKDSRERIDAWQNLIFVDNLPEKTAIYEDLSRHSVAATLGWEGHGVHEAFKSPDKPSRWYSAFIAACKAAESDLEANSWDPANPNVETAESGVVDTAESDKEPVTGFHPGPVHLYFAKPVVIVDGPLISAQLNDNEILLTEIDYANFQFAFRTPEYTTGTYSVDIVRLSALADYLTLAEKRLDDIFAGLCRESHCSV
jgi:hypothetical protein